MFEQVLPDTTRKLLSALNDEINKQNFYLGGGSGLSLQLGHRISEDLDFFTTKSFHPQQLAHYLDSNFQYQETLASSGTLYCNINDVKVSFLEYKIPLIYSLIDFQKIKVADWRDIMAEKFKTLSQRGSRKDFFDIYTCFINKKLSIAEGIQIFKQRFQGTGVNYYHILKSLVYFVDADQEPELMLLKKVSWPTIKDFFITNLREFEKFLLAEEKTETTD